MCDRGFTMLELVIVLVIIGVIGAFLYPNFSNRETAGKITSAETQALRCYEAARAYVSNHGKGDYADATKANIVSDGLWLDHPNAFGNTVSVGPKGGDSTKLEVTTVLDTAGNAAVLVQKLTSKNYIATASGTSVKVTF